MTVGGPATRAAAPVEPAPQQPAAALALQAATHVYGNGRGVRDVDLVVRPGEVRALVGRSGSGKSTLLAMAGLVLAPQSGTVALQGTDTTRLTDRQRDALRRQEIRMVWQDHALIGHLRVWENVAAQSGTQLKGRRAGALAALDSVGLAHVADGRPSALSGGERQRVAIARALLGEPALLLADEPTGNLDRASAQTVLRLLRDTAARGTAVLIATHDDLVRGGCDAETDLEARP